MYCNVYSFILKMIQSECFDLFPESLKRSHVGVLPSEVRLVKPDADSRDGVGEL